MYPNVLFYSEEKLSFFEDHKDQLQCTVKVVDKKDCLLLFDPTYALLFTYNIPFLGLVPPRLYSQCFHLTTLEVDTFNAAVINRYMKLIMQPAEEVRPIFSIFTTCFHSYEKIKRAYQSLQEQTMKDWEWVIVDDSIEDYHFLFLKKLFQDDPHVRLYKRSKNSGYIGNVKNEAVSLCRGKYVLELDHDDEIVPELLAYATKVFDDPEVGFVYTDFINIYENGDNFQYGNHFSLGYGGYYREKYKGKWVFVVMTPNINSNTLSHIVSVPNHARIWRRKTLLDIGNYNEYLPISDDYEVLLRTAVHTKMVKIPKLCYIQYMNDNSNNFSWIRNSEINRLRHHLTPVCYSTLRIHEVMEQKGALDRSDTCLPIWKRPSFVYRYCNGIADLDYEKQYCILGMSAFYHHYAELKVLYQNPKNDFLILDNHYDSKDETIGKILERFKMDRMKFYSMDSTEAELLYYFEHLYRSKPFSVFYPKEMVPSTIGGSPKKLSIITPCIRPDNLMRLKESIPFDYVHEWIIVYDESKISNPHLFQDDKIKEYSCQGNSMVGNVQRNYGLDHITGDTYVYFLDDDTIMHPDMPTFLQTTEPNHIYTFDQKRSPDVFPYKEYLTGDKIEMFHIDTAMFLIDASLCKNIRWTLDEYTADAIFIVECHSANPNTWIYVNQVLSYYNYLV